MNLRLAISSDIEQIRKVYMENHISGGGQSVSELSNSGITYVAEANQEIIGYINVMGHLPKRVTFETIMSDKDYCFSQKVLYIRQTGVHREYQNKDVGKAIYKELQTLYPNTLLYVFIHLANAQSMNFHIKNDFLPIGVFNVPEFYTTPDYAARLLTKQSN